MHHLLDDSLHISETRRQLPVCMGCSMCGAALRLPSNHSTMCRFEGLASRGVLFSCSCQLDSNDGCCTFRVERKGT